MLHPVFVHFPHPKMEHNPGRSSRQPWNTSLQHRRKFLRNPGRYVAPGGSLIEAPLAFWAEWEAPSYVIHPRLAEGDLPRFLQEPRWERPTTKGFRQNTDPWVFGDCFRYSNCRQLKQSGFRSLAAGSVILFGSTLGLASADGPRFVLDTLFVVSGQRQKFTPADPPSTDEAFRVCTIQALATGDDANACGASDACSAANAWFTLYSGATYEAPINGMYSFVPCRRADRKDFRFARPTLSLPLDVVNPRNWRGPRERVGRCRRMKFGICGRLCATRLSPPDVLKEFTSQPPPRTTAHRTPWFELPPSERPLTALCSCPEKSPPFLVSPQGHHSLKTIC